MYSPPLPPKLSISNRHFIEPEGPSLSLRVYQAWKGNNRFFCGGRFIFGPDAGSLSLTISLILIPVIAFCAFVLQRLVHEFDHHWGDAIVAICVLHAAFIIFLLLLTSGRDPGILPRNRHPSDLDDETEGSTLSSDWPGSVGGIRSLPPTRNVRINGVSIKVKYCQTCMLYRPPRCSHCSICNNCVERFDHHCPWVGQCIGKRNYRFFFMFISSTTLLCLYVFAFCIINLSKIMDAYNCDFWGALTKSPASGLLIVYTFISVWFVGGLTTFHLYLIITNQTTYENFRYRYDSKLNPYNRGCLSNMMEIFCSKIPSSKNNFRAIVKVDPIEFYNGSVSNGTTMTPELPKSSFHSEMGKRQAIDVEEFEDTQSQIESVRGLERCGSEPPRAGWSLSEPWEITPDIRMRAAEFEMQFGTSSSEMHKFNGIR